MAFEPHLYPYEERGGTRVSAAAARLLNLDPDTQLAVAVKQNGQIRSGSRQALCHGAHVDGGSGQSNLAVVIQLAGQLQQFVKTSRDFLPRSRDLSNNFQFLSPEATGHCR